MTNDHELAARREKFIRALAHDLRNPIAALIGYAALIEGELDEENRHFLKRLQETSSKFHYAAAAMVELAWLENGMPLLHEPVRLETCIALVSEALAGLAQEKGVTISVQVEAELLPVLGDEERLRAAIRHLMNNAILYSGEGKHVVVRVWNEGSAVCCSVVDEGIGMSEADLALIFVRNFRSSDPRVRALPGGGLGLVVARKTIDLHEGTLSVVSAPEQGSTFTMRLPAASDL